MHAFTNFITENGLPIVGGTLGALTQVSKVIWFPSLSTCIYTILIAAIGATVGYLVKMLLDKIFKKDDDSYK